MKRTTWTAAAVCALAIAASGCGDREAASTVAAPQPVPPGEVRAVDAKQIRALVESSKGKVVVVNFWATWCPPCVREFPAIIKLYEQYHDRGLELYAVSLNSEEDKADIDEFLRTHKPPFTVYRAALQDEAFNEGVQKGWTGEMPMTLVFNAAGQQVAVHKAEVTYKDLSTIVEPLLPSASRPPN